MGEAARRKDFVEDVRKKVGEAAATALQDLLRENRQLALQVDACWAACQALRRDVDILRVRAGLPVGKDRPL